MFAEELATTHTLRRIRNERRAKYRFPFQRELRYKLLIDGSAESGASETIDMGSGGVSFVTDREMPIGAFIELSISWPVLLGHECPMRLNVFGRVVRNEPGRCACTVDKYEFRTQSRGIQPTSVRHDAMLRRWAETVVRKDLAPALKTGAMSA